jgi:hypothetical protein
MSGPEQNLEFLAKRLMYGGREILAYGRSAPGYRPEQSQILLGTPLYVAMAD